MNDAALEDLLRKLNAGDAATAELVFRTYEPYLRMLVRRMLSQRMRAKFDSVDIVQSVWVDLYERFRDGHWSFENAGQLRAFLVKAVRHRFIDRYRQQRQAALRQQPLEDNDAGQFAETGRERPSETVRAEELWDRMLSLCPPEHRALLRLKRQGCSLAELAERTGLHPSSIRRILYDLARRLAVA